MISTITRRLRDPDSSVRSACVEATFSMSSQITDPPFSTLSKPLIDLLTIDQDLNAQIGAALCLAAAIEAAPEPEVEQLRKVLPRLGKLVKGEGFKAKPALLSVISSIVGVGGASSKGILEWLVPLGRQKSRCRGLREGGINGEDLAMEHKAICLTSLETRRFDKVKVVRETMNRTMELWKEVPGISQEISVPSQSTCSSTDNNIGVCISTASKNSKDVGFRTPLSKKSVPAIRSPPSDASPVTAAKKQSPARSNDHNSKTGMLHKLGHDRNSGWKIEIATPQGKVSGDDTKHGSEVQGSGQNGMEQILCQKQNVSSSVASEMINGTSSEDESCYSKDVEVSSSTEDSYEDLSLIREQLIQIENQQSSLWTFSRCKKYLNFDLSFCGYIGRSQVGINSLETRVQGLEMAVNEISHDLAVSSGRIPKTYYAESTCCNLPGAQFLSPKFWRAEYRYACNVPVKNGSIETCNPGSQRSQHQNRGGFVANTSANFSCINRRNSGFYTSQMANNTSRDETKQQRSSRGQVPYIKT
ncbi:TORTIFOLIA1 protein [Salix suchowensis]|nr:TORTIFOLIA1 protein [Salix suchowensis]